MKRILLMAFPAFMYYGAASQQLSLIKDINPGSAGSNACFLTHISNTVFFAANNGVNGLELWKTNGTEAGTVLVKDIHPGASSSSIGYLTNVNGTLFFVASNGVNGVELWKSDGTEAGTVMVKDIRSGSMSSNPSALANVNGILFFAANDGVNGVELWKSDGTVAGTVMVKDINPFSASSYPRSIAPMNDVLFFAADNGVSGAELWKSDGTAAGTAMVKDIWPGSDGAYPSDLIQVSGTIFFSANDGGNGIELWKSDGSISGTILLKDINSGSGDASLSGFKNVNGTLFFSADNGTNGAELWKTDGTVSGTVMVKDVWPGSESGAVGNFSKLMSQFIFTGNDGTNGYKTWQSDGSSDGTVMATLVTVPAGNTLQELTETADHVYASVIDASIGKELWGTGLVSVLPLQLLNFTARLVGSDAVLNWHTEHEFNAAWYIVERSVNGIDFVTAGRIAAKNTRTHNEYTYTDRNSLIQAGRMYYRLRMVDEDGQFTFSETVMVCSGNKGPAVVIYPNPVMDEINLSFGHDQKDNITYQVVDAAGRMVEKGTMNGQHSNTTLQIGMGRLSAGVYYLHLQGINWRQQFSFVKQ
ncbi:MAG: T9SS type A sorting domain-containing protein [Chitinophagaceae bacterium]|nr:T9SS type A sorting domain-containing protein [Chitinophagaceae bacterium]